jgi:hypothetical protein
MDKNAKNRYFIDREQLGLLYFYLCNKLLSTEIPLDHEFNDFRFMSDEELESDINHQMLISEDKDEEIPKMQFLKEIIKQRISVRTKNKQNA